MGKDRKRQFVTLVCVLLLGLLLGFVLKSHTKSKFSIGHGYLLVKKGSVKELCYPPKNRVISGVHEVVVKNGMVFGTMKSGSYFFWKKRRLNTFSLMPIS